MVLQCKYWLHYTMSNPFLTSLVFASQDFRPNPVDPRHCTRGAFIISRLRTIFASFWLMEAARSYMRCNPAFSTGASIASQGYILRCVNIIAVYSLFYGFIYCYCSLLAVVAVAINHSEPRAWPHPFGYWKDAYTVRRFWGYVDNGGQAFTIITDIAHLDERGTRTVDM